MRSSFEPARPGRRTVLAGGLGLAVALLSGCVAAPGREVVVRQPPPPPRYEPPPPPERVRDWNPGRWRWDGRQYVWVGGSYVERRGRPPASVWRPGRWVQRGNGWVWMEGHWS